MVAPLNTPKPFTVNEPLPVTAWLNVTCVASSVVSAGSTTGLLYTCAPLVVTEFMVSVVLRKIRLAALLTLMRPTMSLPVLFNVTSAFCTVTLVVLSVNTVVPVTWLTEPPVVLMFKAPVLSTLPSTIAALPLSCVAPPDVSVLCASIFKADDVACVLVPETVNVVAAVTLELIIETPDALDALLAAPAKLTAPPVIDEVPASPRNEMPMA